MYAVIFTDMPIYLTKVNAVKEDSCCGFKLWRKQLNTD